MKKKSIIVKKKLYFLPTERKSVEATSIKEAIEIVKGEKPTKKKKEKNNG